MFLNCNYPKECKIPKGRPKELKKIKLEMRQGKARLIVDMNDNVWLVDSSFYFGIELPRFIVKNIFGVDIFATVGAINIALLEWEDGRGKKYSQLSRENEDILKKYLLTLR